MPAAWRLAAGNMPSVTAFKSPAGTAKGLRNLAGSTPPDGNTESYIMRHTTIPQANMHNLTSQYPSISRCASLNLACNCSALPILQTDLKRSRGDRQTNAK